MIVMAADRVCDFLVNWRKTASCFRRAFSPAIDFNVCVHMFV